MRLGRKEGASAKRPRDVARDRSLAPEGLQQRSRRSTGTAVEVGLTRWRPRGWNTEIEEEDRADHTGSSRGGEFGFLPDSDEQLSEYFK